MNSRFFPVIITTAAVAALAGSWGTAAAVEARTEKYAFAISVSGFKIANMNLVVSYDDNSYASSSIIKSTGGINLFAKVKYHGKVQGWITEAGFVPLAYWEDSEFKGRSSIKELKYQDGTPEVLEDGQRVEYDGSRPDPSAQGGTLDPLTTFYLLLREVSSDNLCDSKFFVFDGKRRTMVELGVPAQTADGVVCKSTYTRIDGFDADEMREQTVFPFELKYRLLEGNRFRMIEFSAPTKLGNLRIIRNPRAEAN